MNTYKHVCISTSIVFYNFLSMSNQISKLYQKHLKRRSISEVLQSCRDSAEKRNKLSSLGNSKHFGIWI